LTMRNPPIRRADPMAIAAVGGNPFGKGMKVEG
jgi:hypothetical protein